MPHFFNLPAMSLLHKTLGLISPRWRTLGEWLDVYEGIIKQRGYRSQTLKNKRICVDFHRILTHSGQ